MSDMYEGADDNIQYLRERIDRLKKENEIFKFIKADMDKIGEASYNFAKRMIDYDCENIKLQSRIDRAVEFISSLMDANEKHTISSQVIKILTEGVKCSGK